MSTYFLKGLRVGLRPLSLNDLEGGYLDWLNDAEVCQYNSHHVYPYARAQAEAFILTAQSDRSQIVLAVDLLESRQHIGNVSLQKISVVDQNAEFAILMGDKASWGKGYAKEAAALLLRHGFLAMNLHRIYCGTNEHNVAMQRVADYLGMAAEGRYRQAQLKDGKYVDVLRYAVLRDQFCQRLDWPS